MARPVWSGVITFGLVTVPVRMYAATEDHTTHFHQLQRGTNDRVRNKRVNERTGKSVGYDDIVKGYEIADGQYVTVEREELEEIAPGKSQVIDVSGFVEADEVDPVYYVRSYYLSPGDEKYRKPYELLRAALESSAKTGIATFVMHGKEYLVALRAGENVLALHTLHWADEVRDPEEELSELPGRQRSDSKELKTARQLIDSMSTTFHPEDYSDRYEARVRALVQAKAEGEELTPEEGPPEATNVVDLSEALNRSIERARSGKKGGDGGRKTGGGRQKSTARDRTHPAKRRQSTSRSGTGAWKSRAGTSKSRTGAPKGRTGASKNTSPLRDLGKDELYRRAGDQGVKGRSKMTREQLLEALEALAGSGSSGKAA
ncbi:non-homologous end joining protein Ku [Streptomyces reniochalinae]|uniref:Non-homologous end joining protein Ku n=1 Tax=Streptomyces reniochalinae TaxID=2250578 RepID=A0A367EB67_9ACTN|nr:Ku protein [Streptomyces reniochalinae]RCG15306.1 Ku protein [Streptomyces reniochalinae]